MIRRFKIINDGDKKQWDWVTKTDWIMFVAKHWEEIANISEYKKLEQVIKSNQVLNRHHESFVLTISKKRTTMAMAM
jgi:hypothetical protein